MTWKNKIFKRILNNNLKKFGTNKTQELSKLSNRYFKELKNNATDFFKWSKTKIYETKDQTTKTAEYVKDEFTDTLKRGDVFVRTQIETLPGWAVLTFIMSTLAVYGAFNNKLKSEDQKNVERKEELKVRKAEINLKMEQTVVEKIREENRKTELEIEKIKLSREIEILKEKLKVQKPKTPSDEPSQFIDDEDYENLSETHEYKDGLEALKHKIQAWFESPSTTEPISDEDEKEYKARLKDLQRRLSELDEPNQTRTRTDEQLNS